MARCRIGIVSAHAKRSLKNLADRPGAAAPTNLTGRLGLSQAATGADDPLVRSWSDHALPGYSVF
jgi:hypothetical protein